MVNQYAQRSGDFSEARMTVEEMSAIEHVEVNASTPRVDVGVDRVHDLAEPTSVEIENLTDEELDALTS